MRDIAGWAYQMHYVVWLNELQALFPIAEEYQLAAAIYPFLLDFENGLTPHESYQAFDDFTSCEAA